MKLKSNHRKGLIAGAFIVLAISVLHSQAFNPDWRGLPWLIAWSLASFFIGGSAGFVGGFLVNLIPFRVISAIYYLGGALFGLFGYYLQVYLFLLIVFRNNPSSF